MSHILRKLASVRWRRLSPPGFCQTRCGDDESAISFQARLPAHSKSRLGLLPEDSVAPGLLEAHRPELEKRTWGRTCLCSGCHADPGVLEQTGAGVTPLGPLWRQHRWPCPSTLPFGNPVACCGLESALPLDCPLAAPAGSATVTT